MKNLPIGISTFSEIISENCYYVDKSAYVHQLVTGGKYYFLSRPRRFGKTLFVDTLRCAFEGRRELFEGLYLENHWDWSISYPVIHISFGGGMLQSRAELDEKIRELLDENRKRFDVRFEHSSISGCFAELIRRAHEKYGRRVVILVDEYDKPILDNLEDVSRAEALRDGLKNLYSVIKDSDRHIRFCFITGVSKFSRVSIFSDLNNLKDITLDPRVGAICGYTQQELEATFADRLADVDLEQLRRWYNGYNFLGEARVYNPFDVLLFLDYGKFGSYWFESGTPSFLVRLLRRNRTYLPHIEGIEVNESVLSAFAMDHLPAESVLFQTGYLTIRDVAQLGPRRFFRLDFPNQEVRLGFSDALLTGYTQTPASLAGLQNDMYRALQGQDVDLVATTLKALFSSIPYEWYTQSGMDRYEGYYASVVYAFFTSLGFDLRPEQSSSHGRADLIVDVGARVYVIEFKVVERTGDGQKAIDQIREKGYHHPYVQAGREVMLIGMDFSKEERNLVGFEFEKQESAGAVIQGSGTRLCRE
jgi:hypothetical protein